MIVKSLNLIFRRGSDRKDDRLREDREHGAGRIGFDPYSRDRHTDYDRDEERRKMDRH